MPNGLHMISADKAGLTWGKGLQWAVLQVVSSRAEEVQDDPKLS